MLPRKLCLLCWSVLDKGKYIGQNNPPLVKYSKYVKPPRRQNYGERAVGQNYGERAVGKNYGEWAVGQNYGERAVGQNNGERAVGQNNGERKEYGYMMNQEAETFIANLDEEKQKEKAEFEFLLDVMRAKNAPKIPDQLSPSDWKIMLTTMDSTEQKLYYTYHVYRKQLHRDNRNAVVECAKDLSGVYDEDLNPVIKSESMKQWMKRWKGIQSVLYGRPVVIDMDYGTDGVEELQTIKQIQLLYKSNCEHLQPCHLHFTSIHRNQQMQNLLESNTGKNMLGNFHRKHFLELFPRERLFYLVPEGPMIVNETIDEDMVFILGGIGNTRKRRRSLAQAQSFGIPYGSLPMDKFVSRKVASSIDLYLQLVLPILLDKFMHQSWKSTLDARLPDKYYQKYPELSGAVPSKEIRKSQRQFERLGQTLSLLRE